MHGSGQLRAGARRSTRVTPRHAQAITDDEVIQEAALDGFEFVDGHLTLYLARNEGPISLGCLVLRYHNGASGSAGTITWEPGAVAWYR